MKIKNVAIISIVFIIVFIMQLQILSVNNSVNTNREVITETIQVLKTVAEHVKNK